MYLVQEKDAHLRQRRSLQRQRPITTLSLTIGIVNDSHKYFKR
jgi:hypothetical protein